MNRILKGNLFFPFCLIHQYIRLVNLYVLLSVSVPQNWKCFLSCHILYLHICYMLIFKELRIFQKFHTSKYVYNTEHTLLIIVGDINKLFQSRHQAQICILNFIMSWFNIHNLLQIRIILSPLCRDALLTSSMKHTLSRDAYLSLASQEIPRIFWNPKVHYHIHNTRRPPYLSQI